MIRHFHSTPSNQFIITCSLSVCLFSCGFWCLRNYSPHPPHCRLPFFVCLSLSLLLLLLLVLSRRHKPTKQPKKRIKKKLLLQRKTSFGTNILRIINIMNDGNINSWWLCKRCYKRLVLFGVIEL